MRTAHTHTHTRPGNAIAPDSECWTWAIFSSIFMTVAMLTDTRETKRAAQNRNETRARASMLCSEQISNEHISVVTDCWPRRSFYCCDNSFLPPHAQAHTDSHRSKLHDRLHKSCRPSMCTRRRRWRLSKHRKITEKMPINWICVTASENQSKSHSTVAKCTDRHLNHVTTKPHSRARARST